VRAPFGMSLGLCTEFETTWGEVCIGVCLFSCSSGNSDSSGNDFCFLCAELPGRLILPG